MATTVRGSVEATLQAVFSKTLDIGTVGSQQSLSILTDFANGSAAGQIDQLAFDTGSIEASGSANIDLAGTLTDPAGDTITMSAVKAILVKNTSSSGDGISVGGSFDTWLGASGDLVKIMPGGALLVTNPTAAGYAVTADSGDTITLTNLDSEDAQTYEVLVLGVEDAS